MKYLILAGMIISFYSNNFGMDKSEQNKIPIKNDTRFDLSILTQSRESFSLKPGESYEIDRPKDSIKVYLQVKAKPLLDDEPRTLNKFFFSSSKKISIVEEESGLIDCMCCLCMMCCCPQELNQTRLMLWETNE